MAPRGVSTWRRPYTSIYNDNYRYGTGLYSDTLTDIEKRYSDSLSKTQLRSDRGDLAFTTFSGSSLTSSPNPGRDVKEPTARQTSLSSSPAKEMSFESRLNSALQSSYALDEEVENAIKNRMEQRKQKAMARSSEESSMQKSLYDDASFWTLPKTTETLSSEFDLDSSRSKRKTGGRQTPTNGPSSSRWRDRSRDLQDQVESLEKSMSDCGGKLKNELSSLKSRYQSGIHDLSSSVDNTVQQANDLQKVCKRQANQLLELQSAYDDAQRNVQDALEEMNVWQTKCKVLKKEMDRLREEVELGIQKTSASRA